MRQPSQEWSEFDWEHALRDSDQFAARYFSLLKRFCDLPGAEELIAHNIGPDYEEQLAESDFDPLLEGESWTEGAPAAESWSEGEPPGEQGHDESAEEERPIEKGDSLFYETDPTFITLRQAAIGWCNIYAAILPPEARPEGLRVLFHIGRALGNLAYSIGDGLYEQPAASVAFAKRGLAQLNLAVGLLNQMMQERPRLKRILETIRSHLVRANEALIDHLHKLRREPGTDRAGT